ncbi:hypothetical protein ACQPU1_02105 [Clostridium paraputrificum]|uniref:hypothetical protein n=1 Tax=Clostridium paraputrificum TaxID=29363 RepID=UPI003D343149
MDGKRVEIIHKINEKRNIIALTILFFLTLSISLGEVKNYLANRDRTISVEGTVIDSLNYIHEFDDNREYYSTFILSWEVDGVIYEDKFKKDGTVLIGDKLAIDILKDNPSKVSKGSLNEMIFSLSFITVLGIIIFITIFRKKLYKRFILRERGEEIKNPLYIDVFENKENNFRKTKRVLLFSLFSSIMFTLVFSWHSLYLFKIYITQTRDDYINVNVEILDLENIYLDNNKEYSDVIARWTVDSQVYKKELLKLEGRYSEGNFYKVEVQRDTEESKKLKILVEKKEIIRSVAVAIGSLVLFLIFLYKYIKLIKSKIN